MTVLDDDIRALLRESLRDEPAPLTALEVSHRSLEVEWVHHSRLVRHDSGSADPRIRPHRRGVDVQSSARCDGRAHESRRVLGPCRTTASREILGTDQTGV